MMTANQWKLLERSALRERQLVAELNVLAADIARCEQTISGLQRELTDLNSKYQGPRNTQQDIAFLSGLLQCAKKKLVWEKQIGSLQKRTPVMLKQMAELLNDPQASPAEESRAQMLETLQRVQAAMERLTKVASL